MATGNGKSRRSTVWQVAERAGVSHQTVSRYLRKDGGFRPATVEKIEQAIKELDYRPNLVARSMRTRRTGILSVVLPPFVEAIPTRSIAAAADVAHQAGYFMEITVLEDAVKNRAGRVQELMESGRVEGVLSFGALPGLETTAATETQAALQIFDQFDDRLRGRGLLADASPLREIFDHLSSLGHRRFLHLAGPQDWASARARQQVYEESIVELGLTSAGVLECEWSAQSGYDAVHSLPAYHGATAIITGNDLIAAGAVRAASERGWRVPEAISVTGWDDMEMGRFFRPTLTTVAINRTEQGRFAMGQLIALIERGSPPALPQTLHRLILRESTDSAPMKP